MTLPKVLLSAVVMGLVMRPSLWAVDACDQDRPKFCGGVTPGNGEVHHCMMVKLSQLSPACQQTVKKADELFQTYETICKDDIQRFCAQHGLSNQTRVLQCLKEHRAEVTAQCRKAFQDYKSLDYRVRE